MTETRHYFAGINGKLFAEAAEGRDVLVTFADVLRRPGVWEHEILPRLEDNRYRCAVLDSGAFTEVSEKQRGVANPIHVDIHDYAEFAADHQHLFNWVANLDDIEGDLERSRRNLEVLESYGVRAVPVFHGREPWTELARICKGRDRIAIGFAREKGRVSKDQGHGLGPMEWIEEVLRRVPEYMMVHGFAMTRYVAKGAKLDSVDSTTWIAEYRGLRKSSGTHSTTLQRVLDLTDAQRARLVLESYRAGGRIHLPLALARGQARTVLERFSSLTSALAAVAS